MTNLEIKKYQAMLNDAKDKTQILFELNKTENIKDVDMDKVKNTVNELGETLHNEGYTSTNALKNKIKQAGSTTDNIIKKEKQENPTFFQGFKDVFNIIGKGASYVFTVSLLTSAISTVGKWMLDFKVFLSGPLSFASAPLATISAVLMLFGFLIYKIYKRFVDKSKQAIQNPNIPRPTMVELSQMLELENKHILTESRQMLTEISISVEKQQKYIKMALDVCQDALDVLSAGFIGGALTYLSITSALTPLMLATSIGSIIWVTLFLTRNIMKRNSSLANSIS